MARYIDADYLFKCETCRHCKGEFKCDTFCDSGECYSPNMFKIPTADVVPKSEYDAVVSAVDNSTNEFLRLHDEYQNAKTEVETLKDTNEHLAVMLMEAKQEVAREIFEEIEKAIEKCKYNQATPFGTEERYNPYAIIKQVAKLKKKYTEEKYEN